MAFLAILTLIGLVLGILVVVGALLGNQQSRGVGISLVCLVGVAVLVGTVWLANVKRQQVNRAQLQMQQARFEAQMAQAEQMRQAAHESHHDGDTEAAMKYQQQAEVMQAEAEAVAQVGPTIHATPAFAVGLPFALLLGAGVVFVAFKHGGTAAGLSLLALPLAAYGLVGISSREVNSEMPVVVAVGEDEWHPHQVIDLSASEDSHSAEATEPTETEPTETDLFSDGEEHVAHDEAHAPEEPVATADSDADASRPDWIDTPQKRVGNVYRRVMQSGPYVTATECQDDMDERLRSAVLTYARELVAAESRGRSMVPSLDRIGVSIQDIREEFVADEYYETVSSSVSDDMKQLFLLLEVDQRDNDYLLTKWRSYERQFRVAGVAGAAGGVLALLAGVLGLVKLDTYTKGYYTKRLFIGVPLAIIGVFTLFVLANG